MTSGCRCTSMEKPFYHKISGLHIIDLVPQKKDPLTRIAAHQNGKGALNGFRYFPYSDFAAYQQPAFSFFVKTISTRTLATESINSENLKGRLLNSGDAYLIHDGQEYFNLMPAWNWDFLPGLTSFKGADKIKRQPFNGSVSDGKVGLTSMDYILQNKDGSAFISAKKSWFCYGNTVVCLVADLKGKNVDTAYTAMDQSRWRGTVTANKKSNRLAEGNHFFTSLKWVHNSSFVYVPFGHGTAAVQLRKDSAKWSTINASESDEPVEEKVFMPLLVHENLSEEQSFGYVTAYCQSPAEAGRIAANLGCKIIRNDSSCQAVAFPNGTVMFAFFQPSSVVFKNSRLTVNKPCLLLVKKDKLYASDPLQQNHSVSIALNDKTFEVALPANGFSTEGLSLR
ncbi:MAG: hypothetical protein EON98_06265 [Chitinophagaceae bacterium]|nr:MAG: hypothetical protein EON98_06265 [Chitinophagaceae bacterium]